MIVKNWAEPVVGCPFFSQDISDWLLISWLRVRVNVNS